MTEAQWTTCDDPMRLLDVVERWSHRHGPRFLGRAGPLVPNHWQPPVSRYSLRLLYLLACGLKRVCVVKWPAGSNEIEERFADGLVTLEDLLADDPTRQWHWPHSFHLLSNVVRWGLIGPVAPPQTVPPAAEVSWSQCQIFRDIFGPLPFRAVALGPALLVWNHGTVPAIARHVYEDRAFYDLPILADALEDAGCREPYMLAHCRGPGPHVRGCWVVDLILSKS
jgi:hypothetical protein